MPGGKICLGERLGIRLLARPPALSCCPVLLPRPCAAAASSRHRRRRRHAMVCIQTRLAKHVEHQRHRRWRARDGGTQSSGHHRWPLDKLLLPVGAIFGDELGQRMSWGGGPVGAELLGGAALLHLHAQRAYSSGCETYRRSIPHGSCTAS